MPHIQKIQKSEDRSKESSAARFGFKNKLTFSNFKGSKGSKDSQDAIYPQILTPIDTSQKSTMMHQVVPTGEPKNNFQQMFNQYTKEEDIKAQLEQKIFDLENEL